MRIIYVFIFVISFHIGGHSQDSLNMKRVGIYSPPNMPALGTQRYNDIWGYTTSDGSEYAIIGGVDSIIVVDVTECDDPQRKFAFHAGLKETWRDFKIYKKYLYAVCDGCTEGLHIFDMSALPNGNVSHVLTTTSFFTKAHNIYIDTAKAKLYAAGGNGAAEGLTVLDLDDPAEPKLLAHIEFDDIMGNTSLDLYVHDVFVQNDTAYCSHGYTGFYVWDMVDLNNISLLGSIDSPNYNHSSWINSSGEYAYYAEEVPRGIPMAVVDLANLGNMVYDIQIIHTFKDPLASNATNVTPHNPFVKEDTLYISYYEDGIKVYDLINPESPTLVGYYDFYTDNGNVYTGYKGNWGTYPYLSSGCILASDTKYGLVTLEMEPCATPVTYYRDADEDTYGDIGESYTGCAQAEGWVIDNTDCDDTDPDIHPGSLEVCDNIDNNCDGNMDEGVLTNYFRDKDRDGFGNANDIVMACTAPQGFVTDNTDCDDTDLDIHPGSPEQCDNVDNNCDGNVDEGVLITYYLDSDNDGFGNANNTIIACSSPQGYVTDNTDCDDSDDDISPNSPEVCNGVDNNCDGNIDEGVLSIFYRDIDGDGYGNLSNTIEACNLPSGYVTDNTDCNDNNGSINPGSTELCDDLDNNCNDIVDENCPLPPCEDINLYIKSISQNIYRAKQMIGSDTIVISGQDISYYAGNNIQLDSGFEVRSGAEFLAFIRDCELSNNSTFDNTARSNSAAKQQKQIK